MAEQIKWSINPQNSEVAFKVRHAVIGYVKGDFKLFDARFYTENNEFALVKMNLVIGSSSITTGDENRDSYLTGPDFLSAQRHKQIRFVSTVINKPDTEGNCSIWGELKMKGISKLMKFNVQLGKMETDIWGNKKAGVTIKGNIYRSDWGFFWNQIVDPFGFMVGEEVIISINMELNNLVQKQVYKQLGPVVYENRYSVSGVSMSN